MNQNETDLIVGEIVERFHRHVYEVVEEFADAVFWTAGFVPLAIGLYLATDNWILLYVGLPVILPWTMFIIEVFQWRAEVYELVKQENGKIALLNYRGVFDTKLFADDVTGLTVRTTSSLVDRILGIERVTLVGPSHQYITGRRMPRRFSKAILYWKGRSGARPRYKLDDGTVPAQILALKDAVPLLGQDVARKAALELLSQITEDAEGVTL